MRSSDGPGMLCYKVDMCVFYRNGCCSKKADCPFAHDEKDLRMRPDLRKTKLCSNWQKGECKMSAEKCNYAHGEDDKKSGNPNWKTSMCKSWKNRNECPHGDKCQYAHSENEIRTLKMDELNYLVKELPMAGDKKNINAMNDKRGNTSNKKQHTYSNIEAVDRRRKAKGFPESKRKLKSEGNFKYGRPKGRRCEQIQRTGNEANEEASVEQEVACRNQLFENATLNVGEKQSTSCIMNLSGRNTKGSEYTAEVTNNFVDPENKQQDFPEEISFFFDNCQYEGAYDCYRGEESYDFVKDSESQCVDESPVITPTTTASSVTQLTHVCDIQHDQDQMTLSSESLTFQAKPSNCEMQQSGELFAEFTPKMTHQQFVTPDTATSVTTPLLYRDLSVACELPPAVDPIVLPRTLSGAGPNMQLDQAALYILPTNYSDCYSSTCCHPPSALAIIGQYEHTPIHATRVLNNAVPIVYEE